MALDPIYYEFSPRLLMKKEPLMKEYLISKKKEYEKILGLITESTINAKERRNGVIEKISIIDNMINYF